jgi:hypothetical protein
MNSNTSPDRPEPQLGQGHIYDPSEIPAAALVKPARKSAGQSIAEMGQGLARRWEKPAFRRTCWALLALGVIGAGAYWYMELRPKPVPLVAEDDLDDVLNYTLLTDDFNKLSIDERLAIIKELVARMKGMDSGDSALMAAFAAGISGKARDQLQKNADKLAIDVWDKFAQSYEKIAKDQRDKHLDDAFVEFTKMMEDIAGISRNVPDEKRLSDAKSQAKRDMDRVKGRAMRAEYVDNFFQMYSQRGSKETSPAQRGRMTRFAQDMTRHLRGQDIDSGKPKPTPEGAPATSPDNKPK